MALGIGPGVEAVEQVDAPKLVPPMMSMSPTAGLFSMPVPPQPSGQGREDELARVQRPDDDIRTVPRLR
jgi:hypothetical protein